MEFEIRFGMIYILTGVHCIFMYTSKNTPLTIENVRAYMNALHVWYTYVNRAMAGARDMPGGI